MSGVVGGGGVNGVIGDDVVGAAAEDFGCAEGGEAAGAVDIGVHGGDGAADDGVDGAGVEDGGGVDLFDVAGMCNGGDGRGGGECGEGEEEFFHGRGCWFLVSSSWFLVPGLGAGESTLAIRRAGFNSGKWGRRGANVKNC